jgi:hypothetical protein
MLPMRVFAFASLLRLGYRVAVKEVSDADGVRAGATMEWFLFWVLCAVVSAMIGSRKGASVASFFLGFFFGPFGILFALLIRGNKVPCPFCKELMHMQATVCPHCQREVPSPAPAEPTIWEKKQQAKAEKAARERAADVVRKATEK